MLLWRRRGAFFAIAVATGGLGLAAAARPSLADDATGAASSEARRHFENGRALYGHGAYREALAELEEAHTLDPSAKDLVFNLGVVEEKLGEIDAALRWFHAYTTMTLTPQERDRADAYVRRLEGARRELEHAPPAPSGSAAPAPLATDAEAPPAPAMPSHGRVDAATVTALGVGVASLAFGVVLGAKALADRPDDFVTGVSGTYGDLLDRVHTAHEEAVAADVGFAVAAAAGVAAAVLFFARPSQAQDPTAAGARPSATVSAAPLLGGGAIFVQGSL